MKTRTVVLLIVAALLILGGATTVICAWMAVGCDFSALNTQDFRHTTHTVEQAFDDLHITVSATDVQLVPTTADHTVIACRESDKLTYTATVREGTLFIREEDARRWYDHIGVFFTEQELIVQLPQDAYRSLYLRAASGDITLPDSLSFDDMTLETASGDIETAAAAKTVSLKAVSGDIDVRGDDVDSLKVITTSGEIAIAVDCANNLQIESTSGDIDLSHIAATSLTVAVTSGDIDMEEVTAEQDITLKSVSGDMELDRCDAAVLTLKTTSGDVEGSLLTPKQFVTDTVSGAVAVPPSIGDDTCAVKTVSGNIRFVID